MVTSLQCFARLAYTTKSTTTIAAYTNDVLLSFPRRHPCPPTHHAHFSMHVLAPRPARERVFPEVVPS